MKGIADTGFIVAFGNRDDRHHVWALDVAKTVAEPLLTCEAVLAEAMFHLGSASYVFSLLQDELLKLDFDLAGNLQQLQDFGRRYADRKPDLADLCLIRMSELRPRHVVITVDENNFRVYRRNKEKAFRFWSHPLDNHRSRVCAERPPVEDVEGDAYKQLVAFKNVDD
jgi:hypothetical protein